MPGNIGAPRSPTGQRAEASHAENQTAEILPIPPTGECVRACYLTCSIRFFATPPSPILVFSAQG